VSCRRRRERANAGCGLVAFKFEDDDKGDFQSSWGATPVTCYLVKGSDDYAELGRVALATTGARAALCLGGGAIVAAEQRLCPDVEFRVFDCGRWNGCAFERPALQEVLTYDARLSLDVAATPSRYFLVASPLVVKPSSLGPACGLGLFTAVPRRRGDEICQYAGTALATREALRLRDKSYLMRLGPARYVDARPHLGVLARYINDARHPRAANVAFLKRPDEGRAVVRAQRDVAPGEELFATYGPAYWLAAKLARVQPLCAMPEAKVRAILASSRHFFRRRTAADDGGQQQSRTSSSAEYYF